MRPLTVIEMDLRGVLSERPLAVVAGTNEHREHLDDREEQLLDELLGAGLSVAEASALYDKCVAENNARLAAIRAEQAS